MKTYLDCIPCFFNQALRALRMATNDEGKIKEGLDRLAVMIPRISLESTPPETGRLVYGLVKEVTGIDDPFKEVKSRHTETALKLYPLMKEKVKNSKDPLLTALRIAIAGNIIDLGAGKPFDLERDLEVILKKDFAIFDYEKFKRCTEKAKRILYLADNAGETVFDRVLIEEIKKPVLYAVRGAPVINDAIYQDALDAGIDKAATIISSGTDAPGTVLTSCSEEFRELFYSSECIISKGQGNYEALSLEKVPIVFLLKVKCHIIARDIGINEGDIALFALNIE